MSSTDGVVGRPRLSEERKTSMSSRAGPRAAYVGLGVIGDESAGAICPLLLSCNANSGLTWLPPDRSSDLRWTRALVDGLAMVLGPFVVFVVVRIDCR